MSWISKKDKVLTQFPLTKTIFIIICSLGCTWLECTNSSMYENYLSLWNHLIQCMKIRIFDLWSEFLLVISEVKLVISRVSWTTSYDVKDKMETHIENFQRLHLIITEQIFCFAPTHWGFSSSESEKKISCQKHF